MKSNAEKSEVLKKWLDPIGRIIKVTGLMHGVIGSSFTSVLKFSFAFAVIDALLAIWVLIGLLYARMKRRLNGSNESAVLQHFEKVRTKSLCPFAREARLYGFGIGLSQSLGSGAARLIPRLTEFTKTAKQRKLDGFIIELPADQFATDLKKFSESFNTLLRELARNDPSDNDCFEDAVFKKGWQFSFNRTRFFITTFGPFYAPNHPRYCPVKGSAFIFFQPEYSFDHHGISKTNSNRERSKKKIRKVFTNAGSEYDISLVKQPIEAIKYIKQMELSDPPVRWWETRFDA